MGCIDAFQKHTILPSKEAANKKTPTYHQHQQLNYSIMPSSYVPTGQDWSNVNVGKSSSTAKKVVPKSARELARAKDKGLVVSEKRYGAGGNASAHSASSNARKIEESDDLKIQKVDRSLSKAIQQARTAKKMTQKELATKINEKPQVIGEYESGKAVPNGQIIVKIERALGCKLPRPGKKPAAKKTGTGSSVKKVGGASSSKLVRGGPPKRR